MTARRIGIITAGGDCPGMNAAVRAVVKSADRDRRIEVIGFRDGFAGLVNGDARPLGFDDVSGILVQGGTILGASNKDDPFSMRTDDAAGVRRVDRSGAVIDTLARHRIDELVVVGGDGSLRIAERFCRMGVRIVVVPKTIDNDVPGTDVTLGFDSARAIATEAVDRLHTTAASHHRVLVVEVMGRNAGWIALEAGIAGGADVILIPEITFDWDPVAAAIRDRVRRGRRFSIVVVAEGARCPDGGTVVRELVHESSEPIRLGGVGAVVTRALQARVPFEVRSVVLGHVQRGGPPTAFDRVLATRLGVAAIEALAEGESACMVAVRGDRVDRVPLSDLVGRTRTIDPAGVRVQAARRIGTIFGDRSNGHAAAA